jgi:hypothetical protein
LCTCHCVTPKTCHCVTCHRSLQNRARGIAVQRQRFHSRPASPVRELSKKLDRSMNQHPERSMHAAAAGVQLDASAGSHLWTLHWSHSVAASDTHALAPRVGRYSIIGNGGPCRKCTERLGSADHGKWGFSVVNHRTETVLVGSWSCKPCFLQCAPWDMAEDRGQSRCCGHATWSPLPKLVPDQSGFCCTLESCSNTYRGPQHSLGRIRRVFRCSMMAPVTCYAAGAV